MKIRARVVTKLPASLQAAGGLKVEKQNGRWTFGPDWNVLALETSLPDAAGRHLWTLNPITGVYTRLSVQALIDNLPIGPAGEDGALIFVQNDAPDTDNPENSIWIDADSTDYDLYQLVASTWTDTGVNLKGATGNPGANGVSPAVFVQNDAPGTSYPEGSLWIDADSANNDLYQLQSGSWVDTGVNLKGADGAGTGDVTSDTATSVDGEIALFKGTSGKEIKRASTTGLLKASSGVIGTASAGTDYLAPAEIGVTVQGYTTAKRQGKASRWINADELLPRITNGAQVEVAERSTNKNPYVYLAYDTTTQEFAHFKWRPPKTWNKSTITAIPYWSHPSTTTNFGVVWGFSAVAISDDDPTDAAMGTAQTSTDTGGTTNDLYVGPETSAITVGGSPAEGDLIDICISRNPSDGSDTMAVDAHLIGVRLIYTENAANED